mgnify:CR=1 FL=1
MLRSGAAIRKQPLLLALEQDLAQLRQIATAAAEKPVDMSALLSNEEAEVVGRYLMAQLHGQAFGVMAEVRMVNAVKARLSELVERMS